MIYQVFDIKENKYIFEGNEEEIAELLNTTPLNVISASNKKNNVKKRYRLDKKNPRIRLNNRLYGVSDNREEDLTVFVGMYDEVKDFLEISKSSLNDAISRGTKPKRRYTVFEVI